MCEQSSAAYSHHCLQDRRYSAVKSKLVDTAPDWTEMQDVWNDKKMYNS